MFREQPQTAPPVIASAPRVKTPETVLKVVGTATGSNPYLALLKRPIVELWTPVMLRACRTSNSRL